MKGILENYSDTTVATRALAALADAYARAGDAEHERMARAAVAEREGAEGAAATPDSKSGSVVAGGVRRQGRRSRDERVPRRSHRALRSGDKA